MPLIVFGIAVVVAVADAMLRMWSLGYTGRDEYGGKVTVKLRGRLRGRRMGLVEDERTTIVN
jgi:hypothetical protein